MYLRTLGRLELEGSTFQRPKLLLLLAYLSIEGPKSRRHLAELLWSDATDPATSVRMALLQLRNAAPSVLATNPGAVEVAVPSDAREFLKLVDGDDLTSAAELYRGSFLPGFHLPGWGVEIEEWVYATRELLAERARHTLLELGERDAALGDLRAGALRAGQALALEAAPPPEPEDFRRLHALLVAGDSHKADEVVKLAREYGLELTVTRDEARRQLYAPAQVAQSRRTSTRLPRRNTEFVGRDPELLELARLLARPDTSLVTVVGAGGVGKTSLAAQLAAGEVQAGHFAGGVHFVALESLSGPELIAPAIAGAVGLSLAGERPPMAELAEMLRGQAVLIVLDNFEHLLDGVVAVGELLSGCPDAKVLVTSREPLGLTAERVFRLEGLPLPPRQLSLDGAQHQEAVVLFVQRARRASHDFALTEAQLQHVITICHLVEGLPLGIELAAACVRFMQLQDVAAELGFSLDALPSGARDMPKRHQGLRATFDYSWSLLNPAQRALLARLTVFTGGFSREAASHVAGATIPLLAALVDKSLVRLTGTGRYDSHQLIQGFAQEKLLRMPGEPALVRAAHATYFADFAEAAEEGLKGGEQAAWLKRLDAETGNLRAMLGWAVGAVAAVAEDVRPMGHDLEDAFQAAATEAARVTALDTGLRVLGALWQYWPARGQASEWRAWYARLLSHPAAQRGTAVRAKALSGAGTLAFAQNDFAVAGTYHAAALAIRRELGSAWGVAASLYNLGGVHAARGELMAAKRLFEESLAVMRDLGNDWSVAVALSNLGLLASKLGDTGLARERLEESLRLRRELADSRGVAESLKRLGHLALACGDTSGAVTALREALSIEHERLDVRAAAASLESFAAIAMAEGATRHAVRLWAAARTARDEAEAPQEPEVGLEQAREIEAARNLLGAVEFDASWREGCALSLGEAVDLALDGPGRVRARTRVGREAP